MESPEFSFNSLSVQQGLPVMLFLCEVEYGSLRCIIVYFVETSESSEFIQFIPV